MLSERLGLPETFTSEIPQIALDNLNMVNFRQRLKDTPDHAAAQQLYVEVRSFLITSSWTTLDQLRNQLPVVMQELGCFYNPASGLPDPLIVCDRCGLLSWRNEKWQGIKPGYCSDHGTGSPHVHAIPHPPQLYCLKQGVHLRTFLPGRVEWALFTFVDRMHASYPDQLLPPERYPGLDTYDLRLTFSDGIYWAVDAKDHAQPEHLATHIRPLYGEGDLAYDQAFYVVPDARFDDESYRVRLMERVGAMPPNLHVLTVSEFQDRVEAKLAGLAAPLKKGIRA